MKTVYVKILVVLITTFSVNSISAQLTAEAGEDRIRCEADSIQIGGAFSATGGSAPYSYSWETTYVLGGGVLVFHANIFLNDTTLSNPLVVDAASNMESLTFKLTITDALNNTATDSMKVTFSGFVSHLGDNFAHINQGDSVQVLHSLGGGISPLTYQWSPDYNLSNSALESPWAKPDTITYYVCTITDSAGCVSSFGDVFEVYVNPLSIDKEGLNNNLRVYPNPSSNILIIENLGQQKDDLFLEIRSATGKFVLAQKVTGFEKTTVNTSQIPVGIYFVVIKDKSKTISAQKWVKIE